jgi:hypothetical protein
MLPVTSGVLEKKLFEQDRAHAHNQNQMDILLPDSAFLFDQQSREEWLVCR